MRRERLARRRRAAGYTQEGLAAALNVDRSTVIRWEAGDHSPLPYLRPKLARLLHVAPAQLREIIDDGFDDVPVFLSAEVEAACAWLDERLDWKPGTSARRVISRLPQTRRELPTRLARRARVGRIEIVGALRNYYGTDAEYVLYTASVGGRNLETSILARPDWLDLATPLSDASISLTLGTATDQEPTADIVPEAALERLAEAEVTGTRLTNEPLYRLLDVDIRPATIRGTLGPASFLEYALTLDLLEGELLDALATGRPATPDSLPLRDRYLPSIRSVIDLSSRVCAGGVLALSAIARPMSPNGQLDHLVLAQERSHLVVNAARQLTVIPKGFHQPMTDIQADTSLLRTLLRELEEELFGRSDLDNTVSAQRAAGPMHPRRLSEPMKSLLSSSNNLRLTCTGFGFNLMSGNYEFACLLTIGDNEFWPRFGGDIEANWETRGLQGYSSRDAESLARLMLTPTWNNEGLFAFSRGINQLTCDSP